VLVPTDDWGRTWDEPQEANVKFPADTGLALKQIWQIAPGLDDEPDTLYCGVDPAALFRRPTAASRGRSCAGCSITPIASAGSRAAAGSACTRS
jgi:hypothetical protein